MRLEGVVVQGIICFESLMEEGRKQGVVNDNKPVICKPTQQVSPNLRVQCCSCCHVPMICNLQAGINEIFNMKGICGLTAC